VADPRPIPCESVLPNQWYPCLRVKSLGRKPIVITRLGHRLVLWRAQGEVHCFLDRCPHRGVSFERGTLVGDELQCAFHGFRFKTDGGCVAMPCEGAECSIPKKMRLSPGFEATEAYGLIWLWSGPGEAVGRPPWIDNVGQQVNWTRTAEIDQVWPNNAVRLTESFFDLHHVHWVHRWTVPGIGPRFDDCTVETQGDVQLLCRAVLRHEAKGDGIPVVIEMRFPNLQCITIKGLSFAVCATPIDEDHAWVWARYDQPYLPVPVLGHWLALALVWGDFGLLQWIQDRPLLDSMTPARPTAGSDCYVSADRASATFMRLWRKKRGTVSDTRP
jgi:nitrite reductase/ring-hydroxylating ferredoxin subunit